MTADNTQAEIDKILRRLVNRVERYAFEKWDSQPKDYPPGFREVLFTQNMEDEATEAILDWHNKQIEAVLGRLAIEVRASDYIGIAETIQSERNKLKEAREKADV